MVGSSGRQIMVAGRLKGDSPIFAGAKIGTVPVPTLATLLLGLALVAMAGCSEVELPSWVPFQGPAGDKLPGLVTPAERITELRKLSGDGRRQGRRGKAAGFRAVGRLDSDGKEPLVRLEIIRTLGHYPGPAADAILKRAVNDDDTHVRVVACEGWGRRGGDQAVALLAELLRGNVNVNVRLAAAKALGETRSPAAVAPLGEALADSDPAMQYQAVLALQRATGKELRQRRRPLAAVCQRRAATGAPAWPSKSDTGSEGNHVCTAVASGYGKP